MARRNQYGFKKRQKEANRKKKKQEKLARKRAQGDGAPENEPGAGDAGAGDAAAGDAAAGDAAAGDAAAGAPGSAGMGGPRPDSGSSNGTFEIRTPGDSTRSDES